MGGGSGRSQRLDRGHLPSREALEVPGGWAVVLS